MMILTNLRRLAHVSVRRQGSGESRDPASLGRNGLFSDQMPRVGIARHDDRRRERGRRGRRASECTRRGKSEAGQAEREKSQRDPVRRRSQLPHTQYCPGSLESFVRPHRQDSSFGRPDSPMAQAFAPRLGWGKVDDGSSTPTARRGARPGGTPSRSSSYSTSTGRSRRVSRPSAPTSPLCCTIC